ncbi:MAG: EAL domain-containing protein (putative c-di-GMP-specific phosphodiesterase class I) [Alphaproteobacteria bacterium]|jgi:EAL domain-containing protein (putative c-di-GMP-specific phosphodiesterase class I)
MLRRQGVSVSIDDFGTGYSSLALLKQLPLDRLKIDRSFINGLPGDKDDSVIVSAIISLGQSLGLEVIAEGVETQEQLDFLQRKDCDQVQGFYFSPPLPPDEFAVWFNQKQLQQKLAS